MAFTWNEIQKAAKTSGELVFAMRQSQTDVMTMPGPWGAAYSGYCNGLAIKWLSLRRSNDNFDFDPKTLALEFPGWEATREQNIYEDHDDPTALAKQNLMLSGTKKTRTGGPSAEWMQQTIAAESGLYLVGFFRAGGGHGVAMQSDLASGQFHYFDANHGHFVLKGATRFKEWLTKFLTDSGYQARYLARTELDLVKDKGIKTGSVAALKLKFGG